MTARSLLATALASLLAACGSSPSTNTAKMNVHLVDAPTTGYKAVTLFVKSVEIASEGGWITLGTPEKQIELLHLQHGVFETLAVNAELKPGHYGQMRLMLGTPNFVTLSDDSTAELTIPSAQQTGVKFPVSFDVQAGTTYDIFVDLQANKSVFVHQAGASRKYMLRPVVHAFDQFMTGSITGTLTKDGTGEPLVGVEVTAQTIGTTDPSIARTVTTNNLGQYALNLLRHDGSYHVVSQPVVGTTSYEAKASAAFTIAASTPTATWNTSFRVADPTGSVIGSVTTTAVPPLDLSDTIVQARLPLAAGGDPSQTRTLIVRTQDAVTSMTSTNYTIDLLPVGSYSMVAELAPADPTTMPPLYSVPVPATVTGGTSFTANLSLP